MAASSSDAVLYTGTIQCASAEDDEGIVVPSALRRQNTSRTSLAPRSITQLIENTRPFV